MSQNNGMEGHNHLNTGFMDNSITPITPVIVDPPGILRDPNVPQARKYNTDIPDELPHEKVFPIQIGTELFKLSGASLSSDVPRLISQLYEENIFITIGNQEFQIPRDLFSEPGNSPNYFSLGFAVFFSTPKEIFPGLSREGLLRPPSIVPPCVPNRSAHTFSEILHLLRGYPLEIRSPEHRAELLRDCRYFHLKGLEQKLIPHSISYNLLRNKHEITIRLSDIRQSGISILSDIPSSTATSSPLPLTPSPLPLPQSSIGWVNYARPFTDPHPYELILEIGDSLSLLHISPSSSPNSKPTLRLEFFAETKKRMGKLLEVIATKLNLPNTQPLGLLMRNGGKSSEPPSPGRSGICEDWMVVGVEEEAAVRVDGREWDGWGWGSMEEGGTGKKRKVEEGWVGGGGREESWVVKTGQWRLRIESHLGMAGGKGKVECVLMAVKIDAMRGERGRNLARGFLD
ncbi:BTB POZ domain-containing protein [Rutstroemia sp. NJR-2017a WRK4]|nr:BTB POZ domain-containing protein [Rutstroemia sp. NJR-2017a WRK4]